MPRITGEAHSEKEDTSRSLKTDSIRPSSTASTFRRTQQHTEETYPQTPQRNTIKEHRLETMNGRGCSTGSYKRRQKRMLKSRIDLISCF